MTTKLDEMWAALEAHEPAPEYADAWQRMLKERTYLAARAAYCAAPVGSAVEKAARAASMSAYAASGSAVSAWSWAADAAAAAEHYAQEAIDAIKEVKP
jgi:hypothetical protein